MQIAIAVLSAALICAWSTVLFAWVDERSRRYRRRTMTAQAALRRRIDRELDDVRVLLNDHLGIEVPTGWPEVEPEPVTQPIPVQPQTAPMALGDEIEADFRASVVQAEQPQRRMVEKTVGGMTFRVMEES